MRKKLWIVVIAAALLCSACAKSDTTKADASKPDADDSFWMSDITDEIFERIKGKSFKDDCTLPREDLRYLHVLHVDLNGDDRQLPYRGGRAGDPPAAV